LLACWMITTALPMTHALPMSNAGSDTPAI
jgi:hypothetical protein